MACFASISLQLNYRNSRICTTTHHSNKSNGFQEKLKFRTENMARGENQDYFVHMFDKNRRRGGGTRKPFRFSASIIFSCASISISSCQVMQVMQAMQVNGKKWKFKMAFAIRRRTPPLIGTNFHQFFTPVFLLDVIER